jgi:predicted RNA-binding Zn-ribbon protein involved in translation (DUF1610 family)
MAVIQCSCGKQLRVADEHAGKRIKCPACGQASVVPAAKAPAARTAPSASSVRTAPGASAAASRISFHCQGCGQPIQARPEHAGRKSKCPSCNTIVVIPGESGPADKLTARPPAPRPAPAVRADADEERLPRPRPEDLKVRRSPLPWIIAGVAALLLLVGGAVGGYFLFKGKDKPETAGGSQGPGGTPAAAVIRDVDLIPGDAQGFAKVRLADSLNSEMGKKAMAEALKNAGAPPGFDPMAVVQQQTGVNLNKIDSLTLVSDDVQNKIVWGLVTSTQPFNRDQLFAAGLFQGKKPEEIQDAGRTLYVFVAPDRERWLFCFLHDQLMLAGTEAGVKACLKLIGGPKRPGPLDDAIRRAGEKHTVFAAGNAAKLPPDALDQVRTSIPMEFEFVKPVLDAQVLTLISDQGELLQMEVGLRMPDETRGQQAKEALDSLIKLARTLLPGLKGQLKDLPAPAGDNLYKQIQKALEDLKPEQNGPNVVVKLSVNAQELQATLASLTEGVRGDARSIQHTNNLKQLALAMHNYHATFGHFPPAVICSKDGKPLYSWRVELLPFMEEFQLYQQFKKDEPWDSRNNSKLLSKMPKVFLLPGDPPNSTKTPYQVFVGQDTPWPDGGKTGPQMPAGFPDGTSNTILIGEAATKVDWTRPNDINLRPGVSPLSLVGSKAFPGFFFVALADGSVKKVPLKISVKTLLDAINPRDGNFLGPDWPQ